MELVLLLNRPLVSILQALYNILEKEEQVVRPTHRSRCELQALINLVPLIHGDMRRAQHTKFLCSDASLRGGAVVYGPCPETIAQLLGRIPLQASEQIIGTLLELKDNEWKLAVQTQWDFKAHINCLEAVSVLLGLRWTLRNRESLNKRLPLAVDNQFIFFALSKGRSSAPGINIYCRRIAALCLAGQIRLLPVWVRSEYNPADAPSRQF